MITFKNINGFRFIGIDIGKQQTSFQENMVFYNQCSIPLGMEADFLNVKTNCQECNNEFFYYKSKLILKPVKFCSRKCYYISISKKRPKRICPNCSVEFKFSQSANQIFCSTDCAYNSKRKVSECKSCGKKFQHMRCKNRVFCSNKCSYKNVIFKNLGKNHPGWKGGRVVSGNYINVRNINHPLAINGYVLEHRLIVENEIKRYLTKKEVVHHINKKGNDNRIENLFLFPNNGLHTGFHNTNRCRKVSEQDFMISKGIDFVNLVTVDEEFRGI